LGRYWSHTYAERIVLDPDESHVWLITRYGTFREFSGLSGGTYATAKPTDEHRKLTRTATGWRLTYLDGTLEDFDSSGRWTKTTDRNGNTQEADYSSGPLTKVTLPNGTQESFFYAASGKLSEIRQIGVGGAVQRSWLYSWTSDDLTSILRPDGTTLEFHYDDARFPGYLTRADLVSTDSIHRILGAWQYDSSGNVAKTWRGDVAATGPNAVDTYTFSYTNPALPTQSMVVDPLGQTTTYAIARDNGSSKPKVTQISGDCPVCGTGPNSVLSYADAANPLRPTQVTDGRGLVTQFGYNANGLMTSKTEAAGTPLSRTTTYQYGNASFPELVTRIDSPSTSGGSATRTTIFSYNTTGDLVTRTIQGAESGGSFSYVTTSTFNAAGRPLTVDPPGYGTADVTTTTYDATRGNLLPLTQTDPLVGATTFGYDGLNRRTSVIDPNDVETRTTYDSLDRLTTVVHKGATAAGDLTTTYAYDTFGDLFRVTLPRGNIVEYGYDPAGRLVSIERRPDTTNRSERILYTLDTYGHRVKQELQSWNGSAWVTQSSTTYVFSSRCHLDKALYPDGSASEFSYDCDNNLSQVWDANHLRATNPTPTQGFAYDGLNRLSSITQPWGGSGGGSAVTAYGYDVQDHLTKVTDAEGNVTSYVYGDRDVITSQVSPVSGTRTYAYNEHGQTTSETDARGITMSRSVDALDRPTALTYPTPSLAVSYIYDDPAVPFSKGRLTRITRDTSAVDYRYDRFGRLTQDGELAFGYDANGNPTSLVYPGGVTAVTTYDFADRPATLLAQRPGKPDQALVSTASYLPYGPVKSLTLGNGLTETHTFTQRYFPSTITLGTPANVLNWSYTTDKASNISGITDGLSATNNRTFGYQDDQYFLTLGNGPWGARSWTYDKIGNRLTETRAGVTDTSTYQLVPPPGTGHSPILSSIALGAGGSRSYSYDAVGNLAQTTQGSSSTLFTNDDASHLAALETTSPRAGVAFHYDGRDYLTLADSASLPFLDGFESGDLCGWSAALGITGSLSCPPLPAVHPTLDSKGTLYALERATAPQRSYVFRFARRPVAQMDLTGTVESWKFFTVDHLETPIATTGVNGSLLWQGGFEPFGADWNGASGAGIFLRFPGQWEDGLWENGGVRLNQNVYRWYEPGTGRYTHPDPLPKAPTDYDQGRLLTKPEPVYGYAQENPLVFTDPLGLASQERTACITKWVLGSAAVGAGVGGLTGGAVGGAVAGGSCTLVAPGVGTVGCGVAGAAGGAAVGSAAGGAAGGSVGYLLGSLFCPDTCEPDGDEKKKTHEHCLMLYVLCTDTPGRHKFELGKRCEDCFRICRAEGEWPFHYCRLNFYPHGI
jgi:RHS repeat-associated protein